MKNNNKHPNADWPWWKMAGATFLGFGLFGSLLAFTPPIKSVTLIMGIFSTLIAVPLGIWSWKKYSWASRLSFTFLWTLQLLAIGIKAWVYVLPVIWVYPLSILFITAWILPAIIPKVSEILWREQTAPQTKTGRFLLGIAISLAPVAGALGASFGMFSSRFKGIYLTYIIAGPMSIILAIAMSFNISYQLLDDHLWDRSEKQEAG